MSRRQNYFTFKSVQKDVRFTAAYFLNFLPQAKRNIVIPYIRYKRSNNQLTSRDFIFNNAVVIPGRLYYGVRTPARTTVNLKSRFKVAKELNAINVSLITDD